MYGSITAILNRISNIFKSTMIPFLKNTLSKIANFVVFTSRFVYSVLINLVVMILLLSGIAFGVIIVILFGLLVVDFFTTEDGESSNGSEFISMISEGLFSLLAYIFNLISNVLDYISTNYFLQGVAFFLLFIVATNRLIKSGISGYFDRAKIALNGCKKRFVWAFEPINLFQPKRTSEEE